MDGKSRVALRGWYILVCSFIHPLTHSLFHSLYLIIHIAITSLSFSFNVRRRVSVHSGVARPTLVSATSKYPHCLIRLSPLSFREVLGISISIICTMRVSKRTSKIKCIMLGGGKRAWTIFEYQSRVALFTFTSGKLDAASRMFMTQDKTQYLFILRVCIR